MFCLFCLIVLVFTVIVSNTNAQENDIQLNGRILELDYPVVDAEFSTALKKWVFVASEPKNALFIFNPLNGKQTVVELNLVPICVSISPDGLSAVVGHDAWISHVSLENGELISTQGIPCKVGDIVYGERKMAYAFPQVDQWVNIHQLDLTTGVYAQSTGTIRAGTMARLHPNGEWAYGADNGLSPSNIEKYNVSSDIVQDLYQSPYWGDYTMGGNLWYSENGKKIFVRGGNAFQSTDEKSTDMIYVGAFSGNYGLIRWASDSAEQSLVLTVHENSPQYLNSYDDEYLQLKGRFLLPSFSDGEEAQGVMVFYGDCGSFFHSLMKNSNEERYGVFTAASFCLNTEEAPKFCYSSE